jgi:hypothetical protein
MAKKQSRDIFVNAMSNPNIESIKKSKFQKRAKFAASQQEKKHTMRQRKK